MFVNCYFQEADNEDTGTTHSVQQQNLFNVSSVLILRVTSKWQSYPYTGLDRPLGPHEADPPRISRQLAYKGGKGVSPTHRLPLPQGDIPGSRSVRG